MATRTSPELPRVRLLALGAEVVLITLAPVRRNTRIVRNIPLLVAPIAAPKFGRPKFSRPRAELLGR
eukprot:248242-Alexandrium_andersonii.AAC.1